MQQPQMQQGITEKWNWLSYYSRLLTAYTCFIMSSMFLEFSVASFQSINYFDEAISQLCLLHEARALQGTSTPPEQALLKVK